MTGQATIADYVRYVHANPEERQQLINSFLIKVTEFFRDPEVFSYLREHVLPELIGTARDRAMTSGSGQPVVPLAKRPIAWR